jgi:hypothetical protein
MNHGSASWTFGKRILLNARSWASIPEGALVNATP